MHAKEFNKSNNSAQKEEEIVPFVEVMKRPSFGRGPDEQQPKVIKKINRQTTKTNEDSKYFKEDTLDSSELLISSNTNRKKEETEWIS